MRNLFEFFASEGKEIKFYKFHSARRRNRAEDAHKAEQNILNSCILLLALSPPEKAEHRKLTEREREANGKVYCYLTRKI